MRIRKFLAAAAMAGTVLTAGVATTGTASASSLADCSGHSETVCLYYNSSSSGHGAVFFQTSDISNYSGYYFSGGAYGSNGAGVSVKNHAAAVDSYYAGSFTVYYGSGDRNCSYACQTVPDYAYRDLNAQMKNNNAAGFFG